MKSAQRFLATSGAGNPVDEMNFEVGLLEQGNDALAGNALRLACRRQHAGGAEFQKTDGTIAQMGRRVIELFDDAFAFDVQAEHAVETIQEVRPVAFRQGGGCSDGIVYPGNAQQLILGRPALRHHLVQVVDFYDMEQAGEDFIRQFGAHTAGGQFKQIENTEQRIGQIGNDSGDGLPQSCLSPRFLQEDEPPGQGLGRRRSAQKPCRSKQSLCHLAKGLPFSAGIRTIERLAACQLAQQSVHERFACFLKSTIGNQRTENGNLVARITLVGDEPPFTQIRYGAQRRRQIALIAQHVLERRGNAEKIGKNSIEQCQRFFLLVRMGEFDQALQLAEPVAVTANPGFSDEVLNQKLLDMVKDRGLKCGYYVSTLGPSLTPRLLYRVCADGKRELVRGASLDDLDQRALRSSLTAAGNNLWVANYFGSVPESVLAPALLFDDITIRRANEKNDKLPFYPPPE